MSTVTTVTVRSTGISPADVLAVARGGARVVIDPAAVAAMAASREIVDRIEADQRPVYGVSTGFGALAGTFVAAERRAELQHALIRSHAAGVGAPMPAEVVRAMMLLRVRSLALGRSGVRPLLAQALVDLLNHDITPWVPEHGSLGASGDLAPLAHCALVLLGEGWVLGPDGQRIPAADALRAAGSAEAGPLDRELRSATPAGGPAGPVGAGPLDRELRSATPAGGPAGLRPVELAAKEGLALINGTDGMLGMLLLSIADAAHLFTMADVTAALAIEAMLGSDRPFQPELHAIRPHPGQAASAANLHALLQASQIMDSHRANLAHAVQDAYSMRCAPQVAGAARDTLAFADTVAGRELRSVVDNPVVLPDGRVESTGNFHGAPLGFAADFLAIAAAEVGAISERRVDRLLDVTRSRDLPAFLSPDAGVNSGLMIAQYTAAGIVAENRRLAGPASVDSLPTSGMQEDHVSMGWSACRKLRTVLDNLTSLLAVELLAAVRGLQLRAPLLPSPAGRVAVEIVSEFAGEPGPDVFLAPVLEAARAAIAGPALRAAIERETGPLA